MQQMQHEIGLPYMVFRWNLCRRFYRIYYNIYWFNQRSNDIYGTYKVYSLHLRNFHFH